MLQMLAHDSKYYLGTRSSWGSETPDVSKLLYFLFTWVATNRMCCFEDKNYRKPCHCNSIPRSAKKGLSILYKLNLNWSFSENCITTSNNKNITNLWKCDDEYKSKSEKFSLNYYRVKNITPLTPQKNVCPSVLMPGQFFSVDTLDR